MSDFSAIFFGNKRNAVEEALNFEGLTCTCPKDVPNFSNKSRLSHKKLVPVHCLPYDNRLTPRKDKQDIHISKYNRSVSLNQILGPNTNSTDQSEQFISDHNGVTGVPTRTLGPIHREYQPKSLTSAGSSLLGSLDSSPDGADCGKRGLSPFERDNLLYIQELKARQAEAVREFERQVRDLPRARLLRSCSHPQKQEGFPPVYKPDECAPRGGSPFPSRREFPSSAFSPSKSAPCQALRSLSFEEESGDDWEEDIEDSAHGGRSELLSGATDAGRRRHWWNSPVAPPPSSPQPPNTWWSHVSPSPPSLSPLNSPSCRRRSPAFSPLSFSSRGHTPLHAGTPDSALAEFSPRLARRNFSYRSHSSPSPSSGVIGEFVPLDLSLSFSTIGDIKKVRPELEDVGGHAESILSSSPDEGVFTHRTMLPPTIESAQEDLSEEDTSRRGQQNPEPKPAISEPLTQAPKSKLLVTPPTPIPNTPVPNTPVPNTPIPNTHIPNTHIQSSPNASSSTASVRDSVIKPSEHVDAGASQSAAATSEAKKATPMAFTVELDSAASDSSTSGNSGKKLDIAASISQWAPKHRRNLSLTKVEEHKKVDEKLASEKPPAGRPRSGTLGASPGPGVPKRGGYHSEGYFSSDQDEEASKRTDLKCPRSPAASDSAPSPRVLFRSHSEESKKGKGIRMRPPSPISPTSPYGAPLNETASFLIEKMMNGTPEMKRKQAPKSEGRSCCKKEKERKPSVSELTGKSHKTEKKMGPDGKRQVRNTPVEDLDPSKDDKDDDVSEAGTYTIDKDAADLEEEVEARQDIDGVFGVTTESEVEAEATSTVTTTAIPGSTTDQGPEDESSWLSASEMQPTISRNSPNWIQQWAAQVAEQTKPGLEPMCPMPKPLTPSPRGHKTSPDNELRPRRKLPTPPHFSIPPSGVSQRSDSVGNAMHKVRADKPKSPLNPAFRNASFESHESGGDSDFDTSASYPFNEDERMSASLKNKLRLTGLLPSAKTISNRPSAPATSPRRQEGDLIKDPKLKRADRGLRDPGYDMYSPRRDDHGLQSDSSSEASDPYKEASRTNDNNPPLKFNRAFSLRRARLGCDEPVVSVQPQQDKKKGARPSSAGPTGGARKPLSASKPYQSADNSSVSSPRSYGYGSSKGLAAPSGLGSRGSTPSDNFDRTDGGRFSLRMCRPGPPPIGIVKSPSKSSIRKEPNNPKKNQGRSSSTLSSKEVDFQNWKRRKNYDPMKAAAEGRKKQVEQKTKTNAQQQVQNNPEQQRSPSPRNSLLRSASFHGTDGVMSSVRWNHKSAHPQQHYTSEDDGPYSLEEEARPHPSPRHGSPLHRSPTSPHQLCRSPVRQHPPTPKGGRRPSLGHSEEGEAQFQTSLRKVSLDESGSEGKRSPLNGVGARVSAGSGSVGVTGRPKTKMEALDNLVISTIHSLSVKVRTTSESLLQKLKSQYDEEGDRAALLEEVLSHLSESDQSLASGQTRSTSRELAGILRNLKKIEHALEVIDRVIIVGEDDYRDEDDIDYVPTEWVEESDY